MIDRIDFNVQQTQEYVSKAVSETTAAVRYQKEARRVRKSIFNKARKMFLQNQIQNFALFDLLFNRSYN